MTEPSSTYSRQVTTLTLWRFGDLASKLWMFGQMGLARGPVSTMPGLRFFKLLGTGAGAGFSTKPDLSRYGLLCVWNDMDAAEGGLGQNHAILRFAQRSTETVTLFLEPTQTRGLWSSSEPFRVSCDVNPSGPIVALTRATLKAQHIARFWSLVPAISETAEAQNTQHFMLGLGEVPYRNQVTFSIWSDEADMVHFSRSSPTHGRAVRHAYQEGWFAESLFARFNLTKVEGEWLDFERVRPLLNTIETDKNAAMQHSQAAE